MTRFIFDNTDTKYSIMLWYHKEQLLKLFQQFKHGLDPNSAARAPWFVLFCNGVRILCNLQIATLILNAEYDKNNVLSYFLRNILSIIF